ncbi:WYL domain-containing protein [Bacteriovoracaceae bacterium]|nr:WYL domain-containing protein [Bacteriovoracaceae bacterium]
MSQKNPLLNDHFWKWIKALDQYTGKNSYKNIVTIFNGVENDEVLFHEAVHFMQKFGYDIKAYKHEGELWLNSGESPEIRVGFTLSDWLAFQSQFPFIQNFEDHAVFGDLVNFLKRQEYANSQYDLYRVISDDETKKKMIEGFANEEKSIIANLENSVNEKICLVLNTKHNKFLEVFPHKLVYLEGNLHLVGEDTNDRCLLAINVNEILSLSFHEDINYELNFSPIEIEDFISAFRSVASNEERLVMKILTPESVDLNPPYHFLGNPYITSSADGDLIWAASVEVSDELYDWLGEIHEYVEIVDPEGVKMGLEEYIKQTTKIPLKKAS